MKIKFVKVYDGGLGRMVLEAVPVKRRRSRAKGAKKTKVLKYELRLVRKKNGVLKWQD